MQFQATTSKKSLLILQMKYLHDLICNTAGAVKKRSLKPSAVNHRGENNFREENEEEKKSKEKSKKNYKRFKQLISSYTFTRARIAFLFASSHLPILR